MSSPSFSLGVPCLAREKAEPKPRSQHFTFVRGVAIEKESDHGSPTQSFMFGSPKKQTTDFTVSTGSPYTRGSPDRCSLVKQREDKRLNGSPLPWGSNSELPPFLAHDLHSSAKEVLKFCAYFRESLGGEGSRVRRCVIAYYLSDQTLRVYEPREENSGIQQGPFLRRHKVKRSNGSEFITLDDFGIGKQLEMYGRVFRITDCDMRTREYMTSIGREQPASESMPKSFLGGSASAPGLARHTDRATKKNTVGQFNKVNTPLKTFFEARLGRAAGGANLSQFLAHDRQVLRFYCRWDRKSGGGASSGGLASGVTGSDSEHYVMHYFVTDGSVEIRETHDGNSGKEPFPLLLKRAKLPRDHRRVLGDGYRDTRTDPWEQGVFYTDRDFKLGSCINVWGRQLLLVSADEYTMRHYRQLYGVSQTPVEAAVEEAPKKLSKASPSSASSTQLGFGMSPTRRGRRATSESSNSKVLRFSARLDSRHPTDTRRRFILAFYLADGTASVYETKHVNSGLVGGKFLERSTLLRPDGSGDAYGASDLFIGARVNIVSHTFIIDDMDRFTLNYAAAHPTEFPWADLTQILSKLASVVSATDLLEAFQSRDTAERGTVPVEQARSVLNFSAGDSLFSPQEVVSLLHAFDQGDPTPSASRSHQQSTHTEGSAATAGQVRYRDLCLQLRRVVVRRHNNNNSRGNSREAGKPGSRNGRSALSSAARSGLDSGVAVSPISSSRRLSRPGSHDGATSTTAAVIRSVFKQLSAVFSSRPHQLSQVFRKLDSGLTGKLARPRFLRALQVACLAGEITISDQELQRVVDYYFPQGIRAIAYDEFLALLWKAE